MEVRYRESFLRDLKKLKKHPVYEKIFRLAFEVLPECSSVRDLSGVRAMVGHPGRYRIRVGSHRVGFELHEQIVELVRVLDRREFYRFFP